MNPIERFFKEDIPATFSAGKWRLSLIQLNSRLAQLEKQKNALVSELGTKAWEGRIQDERYGATYSKLEELDVSFREVRQEIDSLQNTINQETDRLNKTRADFDTRLKSTQNQRQAALQKLAQLQVTQKNIELRLSQLQAASTQGMTNLQNMQSQVDQLQGSDQPDKSEKITSLQSTIASVQTQIDEATPKMDAARSELEANRAEQQPIRSEVEGYDQLIGMLQEQNRSAMATIQGQLKDLQQSLLKLNEKKNGLLNKIAALMPELGSQVDQYRPPADGLSAAYAKVDAAQSDIKGVKDQINLTQARLASVSSRSLLKVVIAVGALVLIAACVVVFATVGIPAISALVRPDPKASIRLVESWTLENCGMAADEGDYVDVSVWENRRRDAMASVETEVKLLGSSDVVLGSGAAQMDIAPGGLGVSVVSMSSKGSRVQDVERSVSSVSFNEASLLDQNDIDVRPFFALSDVSNNIALNLEITNGSDFALIRSQPAYAFAVDQQNNIIDILVGNVSYGPIAVDSLDKFTFETLDTYTLAIPCLQDDYSQEKVTFWYFVPLQVGTDRADQFTISGKAVYTP